MLTKDISQKARFIPENKNFALQELLSEGLRFRFSDKAHLAGEWGDVIKNLIMYVYH